ncbi:VanZ family protein [Hymenobacter properus]|uniref:VanZ family protein n=1 Tax=Hymenobacter properus TaxID=2791026 RepID=A0A931BFW3_9BACT|nr:VanZ family protein [Hymenobacter properus]MBF9143165.1 VanZ family protein [Hymenobacter properus]MBR7721973.1 VanZ family protein [Microvirga sp. SRT04]
MPPASPRPYFGLPLAWAAVVLVLTLTPANEMPRTPVWELLSFDTAAHAGVFFVLAGLSWFSAHRQRRWPWLARHAGWCVLAASIAFGALIEVLQMTMRLGRHGEWTDLLSDGIGAVLAVGLAAMWSLRQKRQTSAAVQAAAVLLAGAMLAAGSARAQNLPRARTTIKKLASPELHGRGYVKQGEHEAAAYLRERLRGLKLAPLAPNFTQPFTLDVNTFPGEVAASIQADGSPLTTAWRAGTACIAAPNSAAGEVKARIFLLDTLVFTKTTVQARYLLVPWSKRVLLLRAADAARLHQLPSLLQQRLNSAAAMITVVPKLTASLAAEQAPQPRVQVLAEKVPLWLDKAIFGDTATGAAKGHTVWGTVRVGAKLAANYQTQNLAAVVRGTAQPDSFLVVSAHYDHLGMMGPKAYFPGANDNASGVALLLELAAYYARPENRPAYSVVFLLFGAEEAGLVGSNYFVTHPLVPLKSIKFLVNLDLLGTGEQGATVVNGRVFEAPYKRLVALNEAHHYLPALGARGKAANSDHYPFSEAGVPAFFIYTRGGSPAYHDVNDQPAALSLAGFAGAFGLVRDFLNEEGAAPRAKKSR